MIMLSKNSLCEWGMTREICSYFTLQCFHFHLFGVMVTPFQCLPLSFTVAVGNNLTGALRSSLKVQPAEFSRILESSSPSAVLDREERKRAGATKREWVALASSHGDRHLRKGIYAETAPGWRRHLRGK